jgi:hypothetical protein
MGLNKLERYSHGGYLIKVVVMALAGEVTRELSPIRHGLIIIMRSKASGKGKGMRSAHSGWCRRGVDVVMF